MKENAFLLSFKTILSIITFGGMLLFLCFSHRVIYAAGIEKTFESLKKNPKKLYTFLQKMPKGGDLHTHFDGSADLHTLIFLAKHQNYCINLQTFALSKMSSSCIGVSTKTFLMSDQHLEQVRAAWSMEKLAPNDPARYDHFFNIFQKVAPIYQDFTVFLLANMIQHAAEQHELYLEIIMLNPRKNNQSIPILPQISTFEEKKRILLSNRKVQQLIHQQVSMAATNLKQARKSLGCETNPQLPACAVTVKFQYFVLRENPTDDVFTDALIGFNAVQKSKLIVGVNMVQPEKGQRASGDFEKQMQIFSFLHQTYPSVPISLHAGEFSSEMIQNTAQKNHIQDSIHVGHAQRIGHGAALFAERNFHHLVKIMSKQKIAVEINLTSNQDILSLSGKRHPFPYYLQHHVPVVLSTDDAGISETNLTQEFFKATQRYALNYSTIKQINRNALTYSFLPGKSIWLNSSQQVLLPACRHLMSITCQKIVEKSPKAQLQWKLEKELAAFESKFGS